MSAPELDTEELLSSLIDDEGFKAICDRMARFNVFEAMGAVRSELRHSNFLAYLLSPTRSHGLGSEPLLCVLRAVLAKLPSDQRPLRVLELVVGDLDGAIVYRERANIDLLIEINALNLVVLFENKIDAKAGEDQLASYKRVLAAMYPDARHLLVFLTPDGTPPNDEAYIAFDYADLAGVLDKLTVSAKSETTLIIRHYTDMLRRHIVPDPALEDIARQIYQRHKEAFDFVFDCRPTPENLLVVVDELLRETPGFVADRHTSSLRRFVPESWTNVSVLNSCPTTEWTKTGRTALFEIKTFAQEAYADRVSLTLVVGPAPPAIREQLYRGAQKRPNLFKGLVRPMGRKVSAQGTTCFRPAGFAWGYRHNQSALMVSINRMVAFGRTV